jgi:phosphatidylinositol-3-phosphatase
MMRELLDIRLSRLSLAIIVALSALATVVILSGGGRRTPAEAAALVALRQAPATRTVVAVSSPAPATTASPSPSAASGHGGSTDGSTGDSATAPAPSTAGTTGTDTGNTGDTGTSNASSTTGSNTSTTGTNTSAASNLPKVGHVFEIALSTTRYPAAFEHGRAPYLHSLERKGTLLSGYRSLGSSELADNLAMISGQVPNADTRGGCPTYAEFPTAVVTKANGLVPGKGCVYPETALTLGDQVSSSGHVWRAYVEDMGKQTCSHANSNAVDDLALPGTEPGYDSRHNPFIYFHSLLDLGDCATDDLDLSKLPAALSSTSKTATFSFLAPNACGDARAIAGGGADTTEPTTTTGSSTTTSSSSSTTTTTGTETTPTTATPTTGTTTTTSTTPTTVSSTVVSGALGAPTAAACPTGPVGIAAENAFLKTWVPRILRSPAYKRDGVLVIAFAGDGVKRAGPKVRTGALVLSRYAHRGKTVAAAYTPYSLLRSLEDMLRYTPLARAKSAPSFASAALVKTK